MPVDRASRSPQPSTGCCRKSLLNTATAPHMVSAKPTQKSPLVRSLKISQAASATQSGEVFPSRVALAADVNFNEVFQVKWSNADASPARTGNIRIQPCKL